MGKPFETKRIALDFDDTFTLEPERWSQFVALFAAKDSGWCVKFVTYRFDQMITPISSFGLKN